MITKNLKISQEVNVCGINTWITEYVELEEGDDKNACKREVIKGIQDFVKEENEKMPKPTWMPKAKAEGSKNSKEQQIATTIEAINGCTRKESVEIFRKLVERESNPSLTEAFDNKLKEFE